MEYNKTIERDKQFIITNYIPVRSEATPEELKNAYDTKTQPSGLVSRAYEPFSFPVEPSTAPA